MRRMHKCNPPLFVFCFFLDNSTANSQSNSANSGGSQTAVAGTSAKQRMNPVVVLEECPVDDYAPLFYSPGKCGFYSPREGFATYERLNAFRNVGRWASTMHSSPVIKHIHTLSSSFFFHQIDRLVFATKRIVSAIFATTRAQILAGTTDSFPRFGLLRSRRLRKFASINLRIDKKWRRPDISQFGIEFCVSVLQCPLSKSPSDQFICNLFSCFHWQHYVNTGRRERIGWISIRRSKHSSERGQCVRLCQTLCQLSTVENTRKIIGGIFRIHTIVIRIM